MDKREYMMKICDVVSSKSTCMRKKVGCVFVNDDYEILATGYNGAPRKMLHCEDYGCLVVDGHCIRATHAEANAIAQAAKRGTALEGATLFVSVMPCHACAKMLANLKLKKIIYKEEYEHCVDNDYTRELFINNHIDVEKWKM